MTRRRQAIRALRLNYKWRGVWIWLKGRQRCRHCNATGYVLGPSGDFPLATIRCPICLSEAKVRGYLRILHEPERVAQEQQAIAEGVFV